MADAQFAVDIAAKLTGRETLDDLDRMTAELMGAGRNADFFQQAMQQVGHELDAASAAAKAANEALADGNAKYNELERAANKAAKAAESAGQKNAGVV
ncbi:MAG TPA: hypothetical protein VG963_05180, partial [Polyangiaceae bacterium]|nr:hypothetical protein [Polyangiaceae bacterium]